MRSLALFLALAIFPLVNAQAARPRFSEANQPSSFNLRKIGDLKPTFYWVALETADGQPRNKELKDMEGNVLARVSQKFWSAIRLEGTGKMLDGRVINYKGRVEMPDGSKEIRYVVCPPEAPYGYGYENRYILVPFRSVAVDPRVVPIGSRVFIPKAVGIELPDGSMHDGFFEAVDIGDAIQNKRIDMFTAFGDQSIVFRRGGIENMKAMEVFVAE